VVEEGVRDLCVREEVDLDLEWAVKHNHEEFKDRLLVQVILKPQKVVSRLFHIVKKHELELRGHYVSQLLYPSIFGLLGCLTLLKCQLIIVFQVEYLLHHEHAYLKALPKVCGLLPLLLGRRVAFEEGVKCVAKIHIHWDLNGSKNFVLSFFHELRWGVFL
jgi:hypothetical protein